VADLANLLAEIRAAVALLTGRRATAPRHVLAGALVFFPGVALGCGAVAAGVAAAAERLGTGPALAGALGVLALEAAAGGRPRRGVAALPAALRGREGPGAGGVAAATALLGVKLVAAASLPGSARTAALLLAPMLGAWAVVVECYGGGAGRARGPAAALVGRARFREFAGASLVAFGVTLAVAEAVGLVLLVLAALATVGLRVAAHTRLGGLTGRLLGATRELVETEVIVVLALLAQFHT
jgi:cobalamin synthase